MGEETVESILEFLNDGTKRIKLSPSPDVILVLGNSGTGKSTLTQFLASNGNNLIAEKIGRSYIITNPSAICKSTIESCTITPELVIDQSTNQTFYDCPGFRDTRSVAHDIGTTYFVRKVLDKADAIKIIFTLDHSSVLVGGNRHGFTELVQNVYNMIKHVEKYKDSVCLVVTKVENTFEVVDGEIKRVPDDVMLDDVIDFLKEAKNDLSKALETENNEDKVLLYQRTIQLIDIFINEKDPTAPRVRIFRKPIKSGPLGEQEEFQVAKTALQRMVHDQLKYTKTDKADFSYTISEKSKLQLHDIEKKIVQSLLQDVSKLGQHVVNQRRDLEKTSADIDELLQDLVVARDRFLKLKHDVSKEGINVSLFMKEIISYFNEDGFIPREDFQVLNNYSEYLEFIQTMVDSSTNHVDDLFQNGLARLWSYFDDSVKWYRFLIDLRVTLSEYSIQHNTDNYTKLNETLHQNFHDCDLNSFRANLKQFLQQVNDQSGRENEIVSIEEVEDETKLRFFLKLLDVEFKSMTSECQRGKLEVKGWNVRMSDVSKMMGECRNEVIEIYAFNKLFFDADFTKKGGQLVIIAPELEVVNSRRIILDGEDAPEHNQTAAITVGNIPGSNGADGVPGLPGGSGGDLVCVIQSCKNCDSLTISAVGGRGGPGQDGSDGVPGRNGESARILAAATIDKWMEEWWRDGFSPSCGEGQRQKRDGGLFLFFLAGVLAAAAANASKRTKCYVTGKLGGPGGNGGDGGVGGEGGNAGRVKMLYEKSFPTGRGPNINVAKGPQGAPGAGGNGATGGKTGDTLYQDLVEYKAYDSATENIHYESSFYMSRKGFRGTPGKNKVGLVKPTSGDNISLSYFLNRFKNYLQLGMGYSILDSTMKHFLEYFQTHEKSKRSLLAMPAFFNVIPSISTNLENKGVDQEIKLPEIVNSNTRTDYYEYNSTGHPVDYGLLNTQSNLLLMDLIIRKYKGDNETRFKRMKLDDSNDEDAHVLAYNAHVPAENFTASKITT